MKKVRDDGLFSYMYILHSYCNNFVGIGVFINANAESWNWLFGILHGHHAVFASPFT